MKNNTTHTPLLGLPAGDIAFFDNYIPSLDDGTYTIKAKTEIIGLETLSYFETPIEQQFEVRGPQFSLPAIEVHSVYPPKNSNSAYDQYLPSVVLNKRVFPWERLFDKNDKTIPWICLMVFAEGEININNETNSPLISSTVSQFLAPNDDVLKPDIKPINVPEEVLASTCSSVQITKEVFDALIPKINELSYLSHVRQVNTGDQITAPFEDSGSFSVVSGNRLLKTEDNSGTRFYAHLVSIEGYFDIMKGTTAWPTKESNPSAPKDIALASLYNWTFLSQPEALSFKQLVENFVAQAGDDPDNLLLRRYVIPPESPTTAMLDTLMRLKNGYVPLNYNTPSGENTFSWYRGALTPVIAQPLPRSSEEYHYPSASSMMIYDKVTGIFDQSYATAWSIGRALALADGTFAKALLLYRKKSYSIIGQLMDALEKADDASEADLSEIIKKSVVRDTFRKAVSENGGNSLSKLFRSPLKTSKSRKEDTETITKENPVEVAKSFFANVDVQEFLKEEVENDLIPIANWLAKAQLLYNVPFNHLLPDQLALPVESLRFFYIDQNWLDSVTDGALSIGIQSSKDSFFNAVMRGVVNDAIASEIKLLRDKLKGTATNDHEGDSNKEAMSGILIRSEVVSGWPGLVVKGFKGDFQTGTQLKMLRMDRLSTNVLLCIFLDIPETIMLAEPQQGLCFGVEDGQVIDLRQLENPPGKPTGKPFPNQGGFENFYRPVTGTIGTNTLNINDGVSSVVQTMEQPEYLNTTITPSQFALQMVKAPEEISFIKTPS